MLTARKQRKPGAISAGDPGRSLHGRKRLYGQYRGVFRFAVISGAAILGFAILLDFDIVREFIITPHLSDVARLCGGIITSFGYPVTVTGTTVFAERFSIQVVEGCDSIYPTVLLWSAIIAFPVPVLRRLAAIAAGAVIVFILNVLRVVSIFILGLLYPSLFNAMHLYVWQSLFIFLTLGLFLIWARYELAVRNAG